MPLEALQRSMTGAILSRSPGAIAHTLVAGSADPSSRLYVHANNTAHSLTEALKANFPVTVALLGDRFFEQVARPFIRQHPPREPRLAHYGKDLPRFVARQPGCRTMPFTARVTLLEALILESRRIPVHPRISPADLPIPAKDADVVLALQPSLRLMRSRFDAVSIWRAHQDGSPLTPALATRGDHALQIVRKPEGIAVRPLTAGAFAFRSALIADQPLHCSGPRFPGR